MNRTVPVGSPAPGATGLIVAVNATPCPLCEGLADEVTIVELCARLTFCETEPLLPRKLPSPSYVAVMACWATDRFETVIEAWPPVAELTGWVPMTVDPSVNTIVPLGSPAPGASTETLAVNVTG